MAVYSDMDYICEDIMVKMGVKEMKRLQPNFATREMIGECGSDARWAGRGSHPRVFDEFSRTSVSS